MINHYGDFISRHSLQTLFPAILEHPFSSNHIQITTPPHHQHPNLTYTAMLTNGVDCYITANSVKLPEYDAQNHEMLDVLSAMKLIPEDGDVDSMPIEELQ